MKTFENHAVFLVITLIVTLLPLVLGLITWSKLPDPIAIHFGLDGTPNGWAPKWVAVFLIPLMLVVVQLIVYFAIAGPVARGLISPIIHWIFLLIAPICAVLCAVFIYGKALK